MILEKLNLSFDIEKLQYELKTKVLSLPPVVRSKNWAGWSVLSTDGTYQDGCEWGYLANNGPNNKNPTWFRRPEHPPEMKAMQDYNLPTEICTGYLSEVIETIRAQGLYPRRARIGQLTPQSKGDWHSDGDKNFYQVRLHIPLITNPDCWFENLEGRAHMPADGSCYLVKVNEQHRVINDHKDEYRYHLFMAVWDTKKISQHHQFDAT